MSGQIRADLGRNRGHGTKQLQKYNESIILFPLPWDDETKTKFRAVKNSMVKILEKFEKSYEEWKNLIDAITDEDESKAEEQALIEWQNKREYDDMIYDLENTVEEIQAKIEHISSTHVPTQTTVIAQGEVPPDKSKTETFFTVPSANLPKFNGEYLKWNTFWQRFEHAVHNRSIPKIEKLIMLLGLLEGRALEEVEGFQVSEENYDTIVDVLTDRFGKKPLIIMELQSKLRAIETAKPNPESLRSTVNIICNMCRQLQNLGVDINNDSMKLDIIDKLPNHEKDELKWFMISSPQEATIEELMKRMKNMALKAELSSKNETKPFVETKENNFTPNTLKHTTQFKQNSKEFNSGKNLSCNLCNENHLSSQCQTYPTVEDKLDRLQAINSCTKCTRNNHDARSCIANVKCTRCNGQHYSFLCKTKIDSNNTQCSAFLTIEKKQGMLLTKEITIANAETKETTEVVAIFDSGSQKSYISTKVIEQLKLTEVTKEKLQVTGFGGKISSYKSSLVKLQVKTMDDFKQIYANSSKRIAVTVPVLQSESFESFDIKTVHKTPDIIIGMDYFFDFIYSFEKSNDNMVIVHSIVGKMLCNSIPKQHSTTVTSLSIEPSTFGLKLAIPEKDTTQTKTQTKNVNTVHKEKIQVPNTKTSKPSWMETMNPMIQERSSDSSTTNITIVPDTQQKKTSKRTKAIEKSKASLNVIKADCEKIARFQAITEKEERHVPTIIADFQRQNKFDRPPSSNFQHINTQTSGKLVKPKFMEKLDPLSSRAVFEHYNVAPKHYPIRLKPKLGHFVPREIFEHSTLVPEKSPSSGKLEKVDPKIVNQIDTLGPRAIFDLSTVADQDFKRSLCGREWLPAQDEKPVEQFDKPLGQNGSAYESQLQDVKISSIPSSKQIECWKDKPPECIWEAKALTPSTNL